MNLPIYELKISEAINEEAEVSYIALVDQPAIKKDFLAFNEEMIEPNENEKKEEFISRCITYMISEGKDQDQSIAICNSIWENDFSSQSKNQSESNDSLKKNDFMKFNIINEEQRIISGPLMLADTLIYRNNESFGEHYIKFSADTIKQIAIKFAKKKYQKNVNLMHDQPVKGVTMFESWLVDKKRGIRAMDNFDECPDGSWLGSFFVENEEVWQEIKSGSLKGFSVEGIFEYQEPISAEEYAIRKISRLLSELSED